MTLTTTANGDITSTVAPPHPLDHAATQVARVAFRRTVLSAGTSDTQIRLDRAAGLRVHAIRAALGTHATPVARDDLAFLLDVVTALTDREGLSDLAGRYNADVASQAIADVQRSRAFVQRVLDARDTLTWAATLVEQQDPMDCDDAGCSGCDGQGSAAHEQYRANIAEAATTLTQLAATAHEG